MAHHATHKEYITAIEKCPDMDSAVLMAKKRSKKSMLKIFHATGEHWIKEGNSHLIEVFIRAGIPIDVKIYNQEQASYQNYDLLAITALYNKPAIASFLISLGADPAPPICLSAYDLIFPQTALWIALKNENEDWINTVCSQKILKGEKRERLLQNLNQHVSNFKDDHGLSSQSTLFNIYSGIERLYVKMVAEDLKTNLPNSLSFENKKTFRL